MPANTVVIETCHRVEAYLPRTAATNLIALLPSGGRLLDGRELARHAIAVTVGLDSVAVGEDQVLHQVRVAIAEARGNGELEPRLARLFDLALRAGRRARSWRQGPSRSLADVAVAELERQGAGLRGHDVLVVGSGEMGRLAARALARAGAEVRIASRQEAHTAALASAVAGTAVRLDSADAIAGAAAVVIAFRAPWPTDPATMDVLRAGASFVVDLSVPPAVPSELAGILGRRFIGADDLARLGQTVDASGVADRARLERLLVETEAEYTSWLAASDARRVAESLAERAEREREAELAALWPRLPPLEPEVRDAIEGMSRHLARRLLREPIQRLGDDPDGRRERAVREAFGL
jgi:glutamyl-tRNA reductase